MDRKEIVKALGEHFGKTPRYLGVPSFAYEIETQDAIYTIDRHGTITNIKGDVVTLDEILNAPHSEELTIEQEPIVVEFSDEQRIDGFELSLPMAGHTGCTLRNIINMIFAKQHLIIKALEIEELLMDETFVEDLDKKEINSIIDFKAVIEEFGEGRCQGITFDFEKGTITFNMTTDVLKQERINAFMVLMFHINESAKKQKRASFKKAQDDNPKYAFRTYLTRLGMNGSEFKAVRKVLLANLEGSGAFRNIAHD